MSNDSDFALNPNSRAHSQTLGLDMALNVLLALCAVISFGCLAVESLKPKAQRDRRRSWLPPRPAETTLRQVMRLPIFLWSMCGVLGFGRIFLLEPTSTMHESNCRTTFEVNPDIGGLGVRVALYVMMGVTFVSLILGSCGYRRETGTKELGIASLVSLVYTTYNLLKVLTFGGGLDFNENLTVCLCIDALCVTNLMTLSDKTVLASRWYVGVSASAQVICLVSMTVALHLEPSTSSSTDDCDTAVWWGTISAHTRLPQTTYWYLAARLVTSLHTISLAIQHTFEFDAAKKLHDDRASGSTDDDSGFAGLPASAFSVWWASWPGVFIACASMQKLLHDANCGSFSDWGQGATCIAALIGILHWAFLVLRGLGKAPRSSVPFKWFDPAKRQLVDYPRLKMREFPDSLDEEELSALFQDLHQSVKMRDNAATTRILRQTDRRSRRGERISFDGALHAETCLMVAVQHGDVNFVDSLLHRNASLDVPETKSALVQAVQSGQWDILQNPLDSFRSKVESALKALEILNDRFEDRQETETAAKELLKYIRLQAVPMSADVQHDLLHLAGNSKSPRFFSAILACSLIDDHSKDKDGKTLFDILIDVPYWLSQLRKTHPHWFSSRTFLIAQLQKVVAIGGAPACRVLGLGDAFHVGQGGEFSTIPGLDQAVEEMSVQGTRVNDVCDLLPWGVSTGFPAIVKSLLALGVQPSSSVKLLLNCQSFEWGEWQTGFDDFSLKLDSIQLAAWTGETEMVKMLLNAGAKADTLPAKVKVNLKSIADRNTTSDDRHPAIVVLLASKLPALWDKHSKKGFHSIISQSIRRTALQLAAENEYWEIVELLTAAGAHDSPLRESRNLKAHHARGSKSLG